MSDPCLDSWTELDLKSEKCERIDREETREFICIIYPTWEESVSDGKIRAIRKTNDER